MSTQRTPDETINRLVTNYLRMVEKSSPTPEYREAAKRAFTRFGLSRRRKASRRQPITPAA